MALIFTGVPPERWREHLNKAVEVLLNIRLTEHKRLDVRVKTRLVAKIFAPKRVGQKTNVSDNVRICWDPVLESKGLHHNVDFGGGLRTETLVDESRSLVRIEVCGVDNDISFLAQLFQPLALSLNAIKDGSVCLQGVRPANRLEPLDQVGVSCIKEKHPQVHSFAQSCNQGLQIFDRRSASNIDDNREPRKNTAGERGQIHE
jgi:hypothetical protein